MALPLESCLDRIARTDVAAGAEGLAALQGAHMRAMAFENVDALRGTGPSLAPAVLAEKLIARRRRGGHCFGRKALSGRALAACGQVFAPPAGRGAPWGRQGGARPHRAFVAEADLGLWRCDTAFGGHGLPHPARLNVRRPTLSDRTGGKRAVLFDNAAPAATARTWR